MLKHLHERFSPIFKFPPTPDEKFSVPTDSKCSPTICRFRSVICELCFINSMKSIPLNTLVLHGSIVGWGTMLQAGRSQFPFLMRSSNFFNLPNPSSITMALKFTQPVTEMSIRNCFWRVTHGHHLRLTNSPPSLSQLSRKCRILKISQPYRHPWPVIGTVLPYFTLVLMI
jgi:hypothetical protein